MVYISAGMGHNLIKLGKNVFKDLGKLCSKGEVHGIQTELKRFDQSVGTGLRFDLIFGVPNLGQLGLEFGMSRAPQTRPEDP